MREISEALATKLKALPTTPGVYQWKDRFGRVIYVGKAVNLRNRVRSYVRDEATQGAKVRAMMNHTVDVDIILTKTEMEALILESNLIKEIHPKYNILLRDDKSYPYLKITVQEPYPRIFMTRRLKRDGGKYLGPFSQVGDLSLVVRALHRMYPLRTCRSMRVARPCLQYHLKRCEAPCMGVVEQASYRRMIDEIVAVLEGKDGPIAADWTTRMETAAEALDFEQAARWRDRLRALKSITQRQSIVAPDGYLDVIGLARREQQVAAVVLLVREGKMIGKENFTLSGSAGESDADVLAGFIKHYYGADGVRAGKEIILPEPPTDMALLGEWLSERNGSQVRLAVPERGYRRALKEMAQENAAKFLADKWLQWEHRREKEEGALEELAALLELADIPERIECFDISHIQGAETVAAMTVLTDGKPTPKEYRKFKLKTVQGKPDDFASMREIMARRYGHHPEWPAPDLIVIDGGKGQLHAALPVIRECGVHVPVISLAERIEEIYTEESGIPIVLDRRSPALQLLQIVRDEAHRFGITYHRKLRSKRNFHSVLDHIEGIGPKRRNALWEAFPNMDAMRGATEEELAAVPGMTRRAASAVYTFLHATTEEKQRMTRS